MDNKHKGKIEEVIYHGDHARVRLNLLGNKEFILKVPNSSARMDIKTGNEIIEIPISYEGRLYSEGKKIRFYDGQRITQSS